MIHGSEDVNEDEESTQQATSIDDTKNSGASIPKTGIRTTLIVVSLIALGINIIRTLHKIKMMKKI